MGSAHEAINHATTSRRHIQHTIQAMHWPRLVVIACLMVMMVPGSRSRKVSYSRCLGSCVHCKEMYGSYFRGHLCAQACLKQRGQFRAVCSSLSSVRPFLDIGRLLDYDEQDSMEI